MYIHVHWKYFQNREISLIAISSSGNSENILSCVNVAKQKGVQVVALSGMHENNKLWNGNISFFVSSDLYGIVEVNHEAILHGIIDVLWLEMNNFSINDN